MKRTKQIALILVALCVALGLAACGGTKTDEADAASESGTFVSAAAERESAPEKAAKDAQTDPAEQTQRDTTTKKEKKNANEKGGVSFPYGTWNDGKDKEYVFNTDGTGKRKSISEKKTDSFTFEVNEKSAKVTIRVDSGKEKKQTAQYAQADETHMTLTFSAKEIVQLEYGVLITKVTQPFRMGTWKSEDGVLYIFREDGSGTVKDPQSDADTAFQYEVNPDSDLLIFHVGKEGELMAVVYAMKDDTHMYLAFESGAVNLTWEKE